MKSYAHFGFALLLAGCAVTVSPTEGTVEDAVINEQSVHDGVVCNAAGTYPHVSNLASSQMEVNINSYFDEYVHQLRQDIDNCATQYAELIVEGEELMENTDISYHVTRFDDDYLSVVLLRSAYLDGAAHPNNMIDAYTFDMTTGQPLALKDLFADDAEYMTMLEQEVQDAAAKEGIGEYPSETSNPISTFYLTDTELVLTDLYFVHAVQAFEVRIPLEDIADMLR